MPGSPGPLVRVVRAFLLSLAFWPLAVLATRVLPVSLGGLAWAGLGLASALTAVLLVRRRREPRPPRASWLLAAAFGVATLLHLLPVASWTVAPGADMATHTMLARLIVEAGRFPATFEPLYPIHDFGAYTAGLPAIAAVLTALAGIPVRQATLAVALLAYPALAGGLFLVARRFAGDAAALLGTWLALATSDGYGFLWWGGNPTILSLGLGLAAVAPALGPPEKSLRGQGGLLFPLLAAGAVLVHAIPPCTLAYAVPVPALAWLARAPRGGRLARAAAWLGLLAVAGALVGLTYLHGTGRVVTPAMREWVMDWQGRHAPPGGWSSFPIAVWPWLVGRMRSGLFLALLGAAAAVAARDRRQLPWLAWAAAALIMVLNARYWFLPGSILLYPERVRLLLLAPTAALLAAGLEGLWRRTADWPAARRRRVLGWTTAAAVLWPTVEAVVSVHVAGNRVAVTRDDLAAMRWMETNLPADALVANNYGDAGLWIPALAFRAITLPHHLLLQYRDELEAFLRQRSPGYLFTGEKLVYPPAQYRQDEVRARPERYRLLHSEGSARLYQVVGAPAPGQGRE